MSDFLTVPRSEWVACNEHAFAFLDSHPVSPGHTLVVTRRLVVDWFGASDEERRAVFALVDEVKSQLDLVLRPSGYNVGFNAGAAAGQTVMHLHVHVIPRFDGDMDDPRGGVRHVIPSEGNYLRKTEALATGGEGDPFARHVMPLFDQANEIAIVAAFVQESGLSRIEGALSSALRRGARVRIITGDYLEITQVSALDLLLDWQRASAEVDEDDEDAGERGSFEARVVEVAQLPGRTRAFHPKSWRFEAARFGVAFVGSSNLSRSALDTGVEWNLRVDRDRDRQAYGRVRDAFEAVWRGARLLDAPWIARYAERVRLHARPLPAGEAESEPVACVPEAHAVQREALAALRTSREQGRTRALVVLATGLGKTWLAAFDYKQVREEQGSAPRVLFIAHRRELLRQAAGTYRLMARSLGDPGKVGWFVEDESDLSADLVFASVAKLARPEHLARLREERFDYVVVDEVHHAAADSYRSILDALDPSFLLGLTATPDRADTGDVLGLFDDHMPYQAGIARGIEIGRLVPFHYTGVKDAIDYDHIPWRNRRFDPEALARMAQTEERMKTLWDAWTEHPAQRTLVFCCSIAHAIHVKAWLGARHVKVAAVFSGEGSDDRDVSLHALQTGSIDALCAVDVFNEGVDVPSLDRVVMLRPTESSVVFLQQLGRGLRASEGKTAVRVIDFVGNHRVFLERVRALLSIVDSAAAPSLRGLIEADGAVELSAGCSVELELEAKTLLARLFRASGPRPGHAGSPDGFTCRVTWNQRDPILKIPRREGVARPEGETDVRLRDGAVWQFRFAKEFCNVARRAGSQKNELPDLLRRWFGPGAGTPGTAHEVRFYASPDGLWVEPVRQAVIDLAPRRGVVAYPDLRAAAGHLQAAVEAIGAEQVWLPVDVDDPDLFAVRVSGTSMDGGAAPMRDGDWAVMRLSRSAAASELTNRVVLVRVPGEAFGTQYQIKRLARPDGRWVLTSDNPAGPTIAPTERMDPIARLDRVVRPEDLAPMVGTTIEPPDLAGQFGLEGVEPQSGRHGGHLFIFIDRPGMLVAPDQVQFIPAKQRPGETAYVLTKVEDGTWRYAGVGRREAGEGPWRIPEVDFTAWRTWGEGRQVSRAMPGGALSRAQVVVDALLALPERERWLERPGGRRARVLGAAPRGGLRVDGDAGGFAARTISLADIAWVSVADEDVREHGGLLDEERVNRARYLEGTPKGSTRWIDTGWAIAAWERGKMLEGRDGA